MWKSVCGKKTYPSILRLAPENITTPTYPPLMLPVKPDFMLCEFQMKMLPDNKASEPKSAPNHDLDLGRWFSFILFQSCQIEDKNQDGLYYCGWH